jgi:hypothetical protein
MRPSVEPSMDQKLFGLEQIVDPSDEIMEVLLAAL